ncbi:MAG: phosphodiester glycosidase family protein [Chitinophagaceae bacterium]|nr:phosphodiester glycosidase family protein [Chitinophagaceae bacterium]
MRILLLLFSVLPLFALSQLQWKQVDSLFGLMPANAHVYYSESLIEGKPNKAYYAIVDVTQKNVSVEAVVGNGKRYTPTQYFENNKQPFLVVNTTFFEFVQNRNLNLVMHEGALVAYNMHTLAGRGKDTFTYRHPYASAFGISKRGKMDIAWTYTDSSKKYPYATQQPIAAYKDSLNYVSNSRIDRNTFAKWKMKTAVGGGPVLLQDGQIKITNNEEIKFAGKAINDKHPRTAIGYTADGRMVVLVVEGRNPGKAEGADLIQLATTLKDIGCIEAMNLDGGGSSCMLINGKETIKPSDNEGQRPVPAVLVVR